MTVMPETRYAKTADGVHVAYQVLGDGPLDLVFVAEWRSHVEMAWEEPAYARFRRRLASFSRVLFFDKRGTGLSDPVSLRELPTLEAWMDDVRVVMDAAGFERAAIVGWAPGGPMSVLFAVTHPERTRALVLVNSYARLARAADYQPGLPGRMQPMIVEQFGSTWGTGATLTTLAPSVAADERLRAWFASFQRASASPGTVEAMSRMIFEVDVRAVLETVSVPTLVLHRAGDRVIRVGHGRYLADHIPGATYVELPGEDHLYPFGDAEGLLDEVQEFLTGVRAAPEPDRVLATMLFSDIVDSTGRAAELGDRRWHDLLDAHDAMVRRQLERFRGREVKATGDGFLASFDGPARGIQCACAILDAARRLGVKVRVGLHTGECEIRGEDLGGIAVHLGQRVSALAQPGEILVSSTVKDLVAGSGIAFVDRGTHSLKGVPDEWRLFGVTDT